MADPVKRICDELGVCREEAICYLDGSQGNLDSALEACRSKTLPSPSLTVESSPVNEKSPVIIDSRRLRDEQWRNHCIKLFCETAVGANLEEAHTYLARSNWNLDLAVGYFLDERRPTPSQKKSYSQGKPPRLVSNSQPFEIGSSSSGYGSVSKIPRREHIPEDIPPMDTWVDRVCDETKVSRGEALYYLEGFKWNLGAAMEACRRKILPGVSVSKESAEATPNFPEKPSQLNNELISLFCDAVGGATKEEAINCLKRCNWNVDQAVGFYIDRFSEDEMSAAMAMSLTENRGETGSTSRIANASVAIPGMASSQVDAVEEDSSAETFCDPVAIQDRTILGPRAARTTITITIVLVDGGSVNIPFRSNQTARDIHDAIDELANVGDYFLQSMDGEEYLDLNITVQEMSAGRSTTLLQTFFDP